MSYNIYKYMHIIYLPNVKLKHKHKKYNKKFEVRSMISTGRKIFKFFVFCCEVDGIYLDYINNLWAGIVQSV